MPPVELEETNIPAAAETVLRWALESLGISSSGDPTREQIVKEFWKHVSKRAIEAQATYFRKWKIKTTLPKKDKRGRPRKQPQYSLPSFATPRPNIDSSAASHAYRVENRHR